ncbi:MAG: acetyl-CoA decarbonylase/synthase complex subunit delta [Candidatus Brocadiia bacterium]
MSVPSVEENYSGTINEVTIGATSDEGGSREKTVTIGGDTGLPLLGFEGEFPNPPAFAMEVSNLGADDWEPEVRKHVEDVAGDVGAWAAKAEEWGADLVCLRLDAAHPDDGGRSADECADDVKKVLDSCGLPLIVWGVDVPEVDDDVLPKVSQAAAGENLLLGTAKEDDYRTLGASCLADGHKVIAESPCDINLAKQVNMLLQDVGVDLNDIVIYPTTGALGFGMIYIYSVMERARNAALQGDKLMQQPIVLNVGAETGRVKEAKTPEEEEPSWGSEKIRAPLWEAASVLGLAEAGGELFVLRNPEAMEQAREMLDEMWPENAGA